MQRTPNLSWGFGICVCDAELSDAFDCDGFQHDGLVRLVLPIAGDLRNFDGEVLALKHFTEDGVVAGEMWCWRDGDEELAAVGIGSGIRHGQFAGLVELVRRTFGLILEAIAGTAHSCAGR